MIPRLPQVPTREKSVRILADELQKRSRTVDLTEYVTRMLGVITEQHPFMLNITTQARLRDIIHNLCISSLF